MSDLTPKQFRFAEEYLVDLNATKAAIRAGYSEDTAGSQGHDLLKKPEMQAAIETMRAERSRITNIDAAWVLTRLAQEAFADVSDLYEESGALKPVHEWPMVWRTGLIAGIETAQEFETVDGEKQSVGIVHKIKLSDRLKRIELLGKHVNIKAFSDQLAITGKDGGPIEVAHTARDRIADRLARLAPVVPAVTGPEKQD